MCKIDEVLSLQVNSNTGNDHGWDSRRSNVAGTNDDQMKVEFNNMGMQPSTNRGGDVDARVANAMGICTNKREAQSIMNLIQAGKAKVTKTKS